MKETGAAMLGFLVAPAVPALALGLTTPLDASGPDLATVIGLFPIGYVFALTAMLVFGVPAFALGRHLKLIRWWSTAIVGLAGGLLMGIVIRLPSFPDFSRDAEGFLTMGATGTLTGILFWLVWRLGREK